VYNYTLLFTYLLIPYDPVTGSLKYLFLSGKIENVKYINKIITTGNIDKLLIKLLIFIPLSK